MGSNVEDSVVSGIGVRSDSTEQMEDIGPLPPVHRTVSILSEKKSKSKNRTTPLPPVLGASPGNNGIIHFASPALNSGADVADQRESADNFSPIMPSLEPTDPNANSAERQTVSSPRTLRNMSGGVNALPNQVPGESTATLRKAAAPISVQSRNEHNLHHEASFQALSSSSMDPPTPLSSVPKKSSKNPLNYLPKSITMFEFDNVLPSGFFGDRGEGSVDGDGPAGASGANSFQPEMYPFMMRFKSEFTEIHFNSFIVKAHLAGLRKSLFGIGLLFTGGLVTAVINEPSRYEYVIGSIIMSYIPIILVYYMSWKKHFIPWYNAYTSFLGLSIIAMVLAINVQIYNSVIHPISILMTLGCFNLFPAFLYMRSLTISCIGAIFTAIFVGLIPFYHNTDFIDTHDSREDVWKRISVFFIFSGILVSIFTSRRIEYSDRKYFITAQLLNINKKKIENLIGTDAHEDIGSLDSPMDHAIRNIRDIANRVEDKQVASRLRSILVLLSEYDLHSPVALKGNPRESEMDSSTKAWLRTEFRNSFAYDDIYQKMNQKKNRGMSLSIYGSHALYKTDDLQLFMSSVSSAVSESLRQILDSWNGNIFQFANACGNKPLVFSSVAIFERFQLTKRHNIDVPKLLAFLREIESGYRENPYHTSCHAADVMVNTMHLLSSDKIGTNLDIILPKTCSILTDVDVLSVFLAAIIHDFAHTGLNNNFHIQTESKYSIIYNDKSIMENYHLYKAFTVLKDERFNFLCNIPKEEKKLIRDTVIELVLCTDMAYHFDYVGKFKAKIGTGADLDMNARENKLLVMQMALKCADLAHMAKSFPIHSRWTVRVTEEFYRQGDQEASLNLPKSPFMDRNSENVPKSQIGFLSFLVMPMFGSWVQYAGDDFNLMGHLQSNLNRWKEMQQNSQLTLADLTSIIESLPSSSWNAV